MSKSRMVGVTEIAHYFGVSVPTVSNWIRRFDDFPAGEAKDGGKRVKFSLGDVKEWHKNRGLESGTSMNAAAGVIGRDDERLAIVSALCLVLSEMSPAAEPGWKEVVEAAPRVLSSYPRETAHYRFENLGPELQPLIQRFWNKSSKEMSDELVWEAANNARDGSDPSTYSIGSALAEFIADLRPAASNTVLDLTVGWGEVIGSISDRSPSMELLGVEANASAYRVASTISTIRGLEVEIEHRNPLEWNDHAGWADFVIANPPIGLSLARLGGFSMAGVTNLPEPPQRDGEWAFMVKAIEKLAPGGTAYITTAGSLARSGGASADFRRQLLQGGYLRGIVSLPMLRRARTGTSFTMWILGEYDRSRETVLMVDASRATASDLARGGPVASQIKSGLESVTTGPRNGLAVQVPIRDLLTREVNLRPEPWVARDNSEQDPQDILTHATDALQELETMTADRPVGEPSLAIADASPALWSLEQLATFGDVSLMTGLRAPQRAPDGSGHRVLTPGILSGNVEPEEALRTADSHSGKKILPDDVVIGAARDGLRAKVWTESGWVGGPGISVIRVKNSNHDPEFLALAITHPRNRGFVDHSSTLPLVKVRELLIPAVEKDAQTEIGRLAVWANAREKLLREQLLQLSTMRDKLSEALGSGVLRASSPLNPRKAGEGLG